MNDKQMINMILDVLHAKCLESKRYASELEEFTENLEVLYPPNNDQAKQSCRFKRHQWDEETETWGCVCSACGEHLANEHALGYNFCPICGTVVEGRGKEIASVRAKPQFSS